jgi:hypothetical protein
MLDATPEVPVSRSPVAAALLAVVVMIGLAACDDGDSKESDKPRTTSTSSTSTTSSSTTTSSTIPTGGGSTIPTQPNVPTTIPPQTVGKCGNQTDALVGAINGSDVGGLDTRVGQYTIQNCRIAASSAIWAAADVVPNPGVQLDRSQVLLQRIGARWNVESVGTSNVGCQAPAAVRVDLQLSCSG